MEKRSYFRADSEGKRKKFFKFSLIGAIAIFIGIIIFAIVNFIINIDKTAEIKILVAPSDSIVTIDGKKYSTDTTIRVIPGTYDVKIEKSGFISYHNSITASSGETTYLYEYLNEEGSNGTYYSSNEREAGIAQRISDFRADKYHEEYTGSDPIWGVTPYYSYSEGIKISASKASDDSNEVEIEVYLYTCVDSEVSTLKQKAIDYLNNNGINLEKYEVKYSNC